MLALAVGLLAAACESSPSTPGVEVYTLTSVNGAPLPAAFSPSPLDPPALEVTSSTLTLRPDGTLSAEMTIRCADSIPPGTTCEIVGDGRETREGTYSRSQGWVRFDDLAFVTFQTVFGADRLTITYAFPPSLGFAAGPFVLEYQR